MTSTDNRRTIPRFDANGAIADLTDRLTRAEREIATLKSDAADSDEAFVSLTSIIERLGERITALESAKAAGRSAPRALDEIAEATLAFMRAHPAVKFSPMSISENLDAIDATNEQVGSRLPTLAARGLVEMHKRDGRQTMWSARMTTIRVDDGDDEVLS